MIRLNYNTFAADAHFDAVKALIRDRARSILRNGIFKDRKRILADESTKQFLRSLQSDAGLKLLITGRDLKGLIAYYKTHHQDFLKTRSYANAIVYNLFVDHAYKNFKKREFINQINVDTCPYCNRNYIYCLSDHNEIKPEIDHFYPKTKYPFLAMSFYNLIPSCQTCNATEVKGQKDPDEYDLVSPYEMDQARFRFSYKVNNVNVVNPLADKNSIEVTMPTKISGHNQVFQLENLYKMHSDHVLELFLKCKVKYNESFTNLLNKSLPDLRFSSEEIQRLIIGNYVHEDDVHKRPLAKLYQDIARELELIPPLAT